MHTLLSTDIIHCSVHSLDMYVMKGLDLYPKQGIWNNGVIGGNDPHLKMTLGHSTLG